MSSWWRVGILASCNIFIYVRSHSGPDRSRGQPRQRTAAERQRSGTGSAPRPPSIEHRPASMCALPLMNNRGASVVFWVSGRTVMAQP